MINDAIIVAEKLGFRKSIRSLGVMNSLNYIKTNNKQHVQIILHFTHPTNEMSKNTYIKPYFVNFIKIKIGIISGFMSILYGSWGGLLIFFIHTINQQEENANKSR